ncbi:hypothetical protein [Paludisphaera mucosa]|uniref:Peptidase C39 domain-containing protein n=1 Tax=Paludisphaera mucosa TaxID=3030827 RepID=A0ABT6FEI5_9BACT|nr:hypothetical protein [Paludisphaera mucosa]MDG3005994.1 hypothetical protein [Paludisphaera mucosa]
MILLLGMHLLALAVLLISVMRSLSPSSRPVGSGRRVAINILILLAFGTLGSPVTAAGADETIRSNVNDGRNAAGLLAGLYGTDILSNTIVRDEVCSTLAEVASLLSKHGIKARARQVDYEDLMHRTGPCIVPLRFGRTDAATLHVLIQANSDVVTTVHAGPLLVYTFPVDEFRRRWTGHALIPTRRVPRTVYWAGAGALALPPVAYVLGRKFIVRSRGASGQDV